MIVINPNSGPGEPPAPDANYSRELPLFNAKANVTTVGYVRLEYCKRSVEKVFEDVIIYAGWSKDHETNGIYVEGIFLDEAPNEYCAEVGSYLNSISEKIKGATGILGRKTVSCEINYISTVGPPTDKKTRSSTTQAQSPTKN